MSGTDEGVAFCNKKGLSLYELAFWGIKAEAQILSGDFGSATESLSKAKKLLDQQKYPAPLYVSFYFVAIFMHDVWLLRKSDKLNINSDVQKKAMQNGKTALRIVNKVVPYQTKVYRLMGEYHWLIGKQKKALKWWNKSIKIGEGIGARPALSRTFFEVGKHLLKSDSKHDELNGITADEYLEKAQTLFEDMDLQKDLEELDRVVNQ